MDQDPENAESTADATEAISHVFEGRTRKLVEHLRDVGTLAGSFGAKFGSEEWARVAGVLHDLGKFGGEFQLRVRRENGLSTAHLEAADLRERDHSTAGAIRAASEMGSMGFLTAFAIAGHHVGLANLRDLRERLAKPSKRAIYEDAQRRGGKDILVEEPPIPAILEENPGASEMWVRMILSALVDADRLDVARFYGREGPEDRAAVDLRELNRLLEDHVRRKYGDSAAPLDTLRRKVRQACLAAAEQPPGTYSLTAPTASAKTLNLMAFALLHAIRNNLDRVIVALPYIALIEQVAKTYREVFGEELVVEHHSAIDVDRETVYNALSCENWDAPIIVTTQVQLLESLFGNRPSKVRKLHNLARSVVVFDESQTLPAHLLKPILSGLRDLTQSFGASLLFCSATQPALGAGNFSDPKMGLDMREIIPSELRAPLRRCEVRWPSDLYAPAAYADLARQAAEEPDVMLVTHTRADARELCEHVDATLGNEETLFLSGSMCPAHRSEVVGRILAAKSGQDAALRLVATQLVDCGGDFSFRVAFRAMAGMDRLAQIQGRINREMRGTGLLHVFVPASDPPPGILGRALDVTRGMVREGYTDLEDPEVVLRYFRRLYMTTDDDAGGIEVARQNLKFGYVAEAFEVIDSEEGWTRPLVIELGEQGKKIVDQLRREGPSRRLSRGLQRYTVLAPRKALATWIAQGQVEVVAETINVLVDPSLYDGRFGLFVKR